MGYHAMNGKLLDKPSGHDCYSLLLKIAIEIVRFPMNSFPIKRRWFSVVFCMFTRGSITTPVMSGRRVVTNSAHPEWCGSNARPNGRTEWGRWIFHLGISRWYIPSRIPAIFIIYLLYIYMCIYMYVFLDLLIYLFTN